MDEQDKERARTLAGRAGRQIKYGVQNGAGAIKAVTEPTLTNVVDDVEGAVDTGRKISGQLTQGVVGLSIAFAALGYAYVKFVEARKKA